ncbi:MAG TPA: CrcB family protein [Micromonospora sp.]|nr:CrcB family protein [Micromonospora sp.]
MSRPRQVAPDVLLVVAAGGALGAAARYGLTTAWPTPPLGFPWATLVINLLGCALLGALMQAVTTRSSHRLLPPFLGTGILGGFTTFSAYASEGWQLFTAGRTALGMAYLVATLAGGLAAVRIGVRAVPQRQKQP